MFKLQNMSGAPVSKRLKAKFHDIKKLFNKAVANVGTWLSPLQHVELEFQSASLFYFIRGRESNMIDEKTATVAYCKKKKSSKINMF